jgi:hypothetical protein
VGETASTNNLSEGDSKKKKQRREKKKQVNQLVRGGSVDSQEGRRCRGLR